MKLSSSTTFFWKFIFTGLFVGFIIYANGQLLWDWLMAPESFVLYKNPFGILFFIPFAVFIWWMLAPLKRVYIDNDFLYVSNYLRKIKIPLSEVRHIDKSENSSHRRVFIWLSSPSEFGDVIVFMPKLFQAKKTVEQLRQRIALTQ
jgi:hypothetical protein